MQEKTERDRGAALEIMSIPLYVLPLPPLDADEAKPAGPGKPVRMLLSPSPAGASQ